MKSTSLILITLMTLVISACGGSSTDASNPEQTDVCLNYPGEQTLIEITAKGFVDNGAGDCYLARNHDAFALSGVDVVHMEGWTGKDNPIAVIDSGFRVTHEAIIQQIQAVAAYHDDNANYLMDAGEKDDGVAAELIAAHGTAVAALAAGEGVGVAPGAGLWLKAMGDENPLTRDLAIATLDALNNEGLGIINHSNNLFSDGLIYRTASDDETGILPALTISNAAIVAAAGNYGDDLSELLDNAQYQVPTLKSFFEFPDEAENVLLVGVYDLVAEDIALFSNTPGHRKGIQARFLVTGGEMESASSGSDSDYREVYGTSLAAPLVSGSIAVLQEVNPELTPVEAANILLETARRPSELGYGQTCTSETYLDTFSSDCGAMTFGMGIMDLSAAVTRAQEAGGA